MSSEEKNKRIAKNTIFLFLRSIVSIVISLYTSRIILAALGVEDYGVYIVIGGVVAMFTSFSGSLSSAISRFITYELGRGENGQLSTVFSTSILIQLILAGILVLVILLVGGWFLHTNLNIPASKIEAANWVLICSALTFAVGLITVTYNAMIIAYEHMKTFAYIDLLNVFLRLGVAYILTASSYDNLKLYAVLLTINSILILCIYIIYCKINFSDCRFQLIWDKVLLKEMFSFSGWAFFSSSVAMMNTQGINILMNLFFGVTLNAARGVVTQVETAITQLIGNLTTSMNPQVVKSYAAGDKPYMFQLICSGSKSAYFLAILFIIPLFIEAEAVLNIWLTNVPEYATVFLRLTLLTMLPQVLAGVLFTAAMATGNIRKYALVVNGVSVFVFIFSWALYFLGFPPETAYFIHFTIRVILVGIRLLLLKNMIGLSPILYLKTVVLRIVPISILAFLLPQLVLLLPITESLWRIILITIISVCVTTFLVIYLGLTKEERVFLTDKLSLLMKKFKGN